MRKRLLAAREERELSQDEVAKRVGISRSHYGKVENETRDPSLDVMRRIADVLGMSVAELFFTSAGDKASRDSNKTGLSA